MHDTKLTTEREQFKKRKISKIRGLQNYQPCLWTRTCILLYCDSLKTSLTATPGPGITQLRPTSDVVDKLNQPYPNTPFRIVRNCGV